MVMNIKFFSITNSKKPTFCAKHQKIGTNSHVLSSDVVELSGKKQPPHRLELTDVEKEFNDVLIKYNTVSLNAQSQKELLRQYYSAQDKYDYQELLKEKRNLLSQLKRIAKKENTDYITMEISIIEKKDYNRYAPKILRTKTIEELKEVQELIESKYLFVNTKTMLSELIMYHLKGLNA